MCLLAGSGTALGGWFYGNAVLGSYVSTPDLSWTPYSTYIANGASASFVNKSIGLRKALRRERTDIHPASGGCITLTAVEYNWDSLPEGNPRYWTKFFTYSTGYCARVKGQNLAGGVANLAAGVF